jgi:hypothetical protein
VANQSDKLSRTILPFPDPQHVGLTTYHAKDPDTKFPPIEPLRPHLATMGERDITRVLDRRSQTEWMNK